MARKKDFTGIAAGKVKDTIAEATADPAQEAPKAQEKRKARKTYTAQEAAEFSNSLKTTGRKGVHLPRINLAFSPEIYDYVRTMSRASGLTYTEFIDKILRDHKEAHADTYQNIVDIRNSL